MVLDTFTSKTALKNEVFQRVFLMEYFIQGRKQEFSRVGEVSWNKGSSRNILSTRHKRKATQRKISEFFLQDTLKIAYK